MKTLYEMRSYIQEVIEDDSDSALVNAWINRSLQAICDQYVLTGYTRKVDITPNASGEFYVPPAFKGVIIMYPANAEFSKFVHHTEITRHGNRILRPYYMDGTMRATDGGTEDITMTNGDATVTTAVVTFATSDVGQPVRFGYISGTSPATYVYTDYYEYEVASRTNANEVELTRPWRGVTGTVRMVLRPYGQKQFIVYDDGDNVYTSDITLVYKVAPMPLYNDYDKLEADIGEAVEYKALIEAYRNQKYDVDAERLKNDFIESITRSLNAEVKPPLQKFAEGLRGGLPPFSIHTNRDATGLSRT